MFSEGNNNCTFVGRLTKDPAVQYVGKNGTCLTKFNVAVSRPYQKNAQENAQKADFLNFRAWGSGAEFIGNNLKKGDLVAVSASARCDVYKSPETDKTIYTYFFYCHNLVPLVWGKNNPGSGSSGGSNGNNGGSAGSPPDSWDAFGGVDPTIDF